MEVPTAQQELFYLQVLDRYVWELNSTNFIPTQCACSALGAHKQLSQGCGSHALTTQGKTEMSQNTLNCFLSDTIYSACTNDTG